MTTDASDAYRAVTLGRDAEAARLLTGKPRRGAQMDVLTQLDKILPDVAARAASIRLDQMDNATPCAAFRVRDLFDHMIGGAAQFAPQLRGEPVPADVAVLTDADRHAAMKRALEDLLDAAKAPGAFDRPVQLPFGTVPGVVLARFLTVDGMVHRWDLGRAVGERYEPPADLAEAVLASARELIAPELRDGTTFAAEVEVAADAPAITRLVAFTGRQP